MQTDSRLLSYLAEFFFEREMFQKKTCRENQNTHFVFSNIFFKNLAIFEIILKMLYSGQDTDNNTVLSRCMLDT